MDTIMLNAMFVGTYGEKNIDGEIINFYLDDDRTQYYFVPAHGVLPHEIKKDTIKAILMVSKIDGYTFEIIGKYVPDGSAAEIPSTDDIRYGTVPLSKVSPASKVTFRGGKVYLVNSKTRILLSGKSEEMTGSGDNCRIIQLDEYSDKKWGSTNYRIFSKQENQYYKNKEHQIDPAETYRILNEVIEDSSIWTENNAKVALDITSLDKLVNMDYLGINHIIGGSHVELLSSNWLAHYIALDPANFLKFCGIDQSEELLSVEREEHSIDILIETTNHVVVIENKIKSDIVEYNSGFCCQLEKYYDYVENEYKKKKEKIYIILCPDYKKRRIENQINRLIRENPHAEQALNHYEIKTYSELKQCCLKYSSLSHAKYYSDLLDFLDDHSNICEHYQKRKLSEKRFLHSIARHL